MKGVIHSNGRGYDGPRDYLDIKSILVRFRGYKNTLLLSFEKMRI
ncbi:hypothetical protein AGMMS50248_10560 [Deltaproteobacteria bacterium]|nr:hypothetical protein AGMMS50248_10560 [Deltaproteobacteria bacterium]